MSIAFLGSPLTSRQRQAVARLGLRTRTAARATLRVFVGAKPPAKPPEAPWIWLATRAVDPAVMSNAVLAGAYDVLQLDDLAPPRARRKQRARRKSSRGRTPSKPQPSKASAPAFAAILKRRLAELGVRADPATSPSGFVARSAAAKRVLAELEQAARTSMAVLLTGETGTGKDLAARHLHARSGRKGELVPINCAAIPNELIEGELFGYVRGAFSGAVADYDGLIRAASGGTVFLDEVDDTPKTLQIKLLRVLEDHVVSRLGENAWRQVDFRIIAATNRDLGELVRRGEFGGDLYQRLAIVRIELPPLRDRCEDIPELAGHLIARFYREEPAAPHRVTTISASALAAFARYPWPGNVRELRNVLFHALVRKRSGDELLLSDLPPHVVRGTPDEERSAGAQSLVDRAALSRLIDDGRMNLRALRENLERAALELALAKSGGSPARAARLLGEVGRGASRDPGGTVRAMMRRYDLE